MTVLLRVMLQIGLGVALAAGVVSVRGSMADSLPLQHAKADVACQPIGDGLWRGDTPQFASRPRVIRTEFNQTGLTQTNMIAIMFGCGSPRRT